MCLAVASCGRSWQTRRRLLAAGLPHLAPETPPSAPLAHGRLRPQVAVRSEHEAVSQLRIGRFPPDPADIVEPSSPDRRFPPSGRGVPRGRPTRPVPRYGSPALPRLGYNCRRMTTSLRPNIFLTGFSGSGKSAVGSAVAQRLGWTSVNMDAEIVGSQGAAIEDLFRQHGEARFRDLEREVLASVCEHDRQVVATGGGVAADERNRELMRRSGVVVCLEAAPEVLHDRFQRQASSATEAEIRPLLAGNDPLARIRELKALRQPAYSMADWIVQTDSLDIADVAEEVVRFWERVSTMDSRFPGASSVVKVASGDYPVWVGWGIIADLGQRAVQIVSPSAAYVITDSGAYRHGRAAQASLEAAGVPAHILQLPSGESSKALRTVNVIYNWLAGRRATRGDLVLAVGGGVVGDVAGFAAATYLRGMPFAQVPTSMLAMMDSSIGGKTAVDLPEGKNLVGAFHQPKFVLADVGTLDTLPERELVSGWAEAIKHGLILDEPLLSTFEDHVDEIKALDRDTATDAIRRSIAVKADVVSKDEKETLGIRTLLNYGHTIGHAIEAATGYTKFRHGEAVSIGMMGAADIGQHMGMLSADAVERQSRVLQQYGLPLSCGPIDVDALNDAMRMDKKTVGKSIRWVLLEGIGNAVSRSDVPEGFVQNAVARLVR